MARREAWKYWGGFFQGLGVGIEILLPYSSDDWFLQKIDPTCASSKETGVFSCVEQGLGATTSHTTQTMFAALRGVSLTCKNIPIFKLSECFSQDSFGFWTKNLLLCSGSPYFTHFPLSEEKKLKFQFQSFSMRPILSFSPCFEQSLAWFLQ